MFTDNGFVDVGDNLDTLTEDEHDNDANQDQGHVQLLPLGLQRLRPRPRRHLLLDLHGGPDPGSRGKRMKM